MSGFDYSLMVLQRGASLTALLLLIPLAGLAIPPQTVLAQASAKPGEHLYQQSCAQCHGANGDAQGPAFEAIFPRPRDFTAGMFKFRSTFSGEAPLREDLVQIIAEGMPGTGMPAWKNVLSPAEIGELADYLRLFFSEPDDDPPEREPIGPPLEASKSLISRGAELFRKLECFRCHGKRGRGDGFNAMTLTEDWNSGPIYPRNLTAGWLFRGGHRAQDIYRSVLFGLTGTPMPAHNEEEALAKPADRWALVHFVRSLSPSSAEPAVKSTLIAKSVQEEIPLEHEHALWNQAETSYIPLAAQVLVEPRLFQPSVRHLWVQAMYNKTDIAFRVRWSDATSKDNEAIAAALKKQAEDSGKPPNALPVPVDELVLQFPGTAQAGKPLPYFLMGKPGKTVNLWQWRSDKAGVAMAKATGLGRVSPNTKATQSTSAIFYQDGLYTLLVKRKRVTGQAGEVQFGAESNFIPISFSAVDGFKGEGGSRRAVATWYTLLLEPTVGINVVIIPLVILLVFFLLEWWLIRVVNRNGEKPEPDL